MCPRLLLVGQHDQTTGLARVVRGLARSLADRWDVHVLGVDAHGQSWPGPYTVHMSSDPMDLYGAAQVAPLVDRLCPDVVLLVHDALVLRLLLQRLRAARHRPRTVGYLPVDGPPMPHALDPLSSMDAVVVYTRYGHDIVAAYARHAGLPPGSPLDDPVVIPHGIDTEAFSPVPRADNEDGSFVVLNANRNQPRKRIDLTLHGFAEFVRAGPVDALLHLHMGQTDIGSDVLAQAAQLGIADRVRLTARRADHPSITDAELNELYNRCQVGINTSTGEGWGLVSFEHAATGAAQVVPAHTACAELWQGAAELLPIVPVPATRGRLLPTVSPEGVALALHRLYQDPHRRSALADAAYRRARYAAYSWPVVADHWAALLDRVLERQASAATRRASQQRVPSSGTVPSSR